MRYLKVKPVILLGKHVPHVFPQADGQLEVITDPDVSGSRAESRHHDLMAKLNSNASFLQPALIRDRDDIAGLKKDAGDVDVLLVYLSAGMELPEPLENQVWQMFPGIPVIAYSGEYTPMMGLYNLPAEEREYYGNIVYALETEDIDCQLRLLKAKKRLKNSRMILLGQHDRNSYYWQHIPDPVAARRKFGVEFTPVTARELANVLKSINVTAAKEIAEQWISESREVAEPGNEEITEVARIYLAMKKLLEKTQSQAVSVGCLELMYAYNMPAMCFSLAYLRDEGFPAGCEADATATLTMLILEYLSGKPSYMGNLVRAEPASNHVMISHGCSPTMVAGRDKPAKPYTLVHSHSVPPYSRTLEGGGGLTSYVDYLEDRGQVVTIARVGANCDRIVATYGELIDCRDTICDRTTVTLKVDDPGEFVRKAAGNHQVVVWGNYLKDLEGLCRLLEIDFITA